MKQYRQMKIAYPNPRKKYIVILLIVLIGSFLAVGSFAKIVPKASMTIYIDKEPYEEQEEYVTTESYSEKECSQVPYKYSVLNKTPYVVVMSLSKSFIGEFNVKNEEDVSGDFSFKYYFLTSSGDKILEPKSKTIPADGSTYFAFVYSAKTDEDLATGNPLADKIPTKESCEDVTKERNVTKTRTVTKYRDVERQKPETGYVTLFGYFFVK